MKKMRIVILLFLAFSVALIAGCQGVGNDGYGSLPNEKLTKDSASVFTVDVNPGVRIYVSSDGKVLAFEATNQDGETLTAELELEGEDYRTAIDKLIDKMNEKGYLSGEESTVLISIEKEAEIISGEIKAELERAFDKLDKDAAIIQQELTALNEELEEATNELAKRCNISKGKAHLIEKIREEFPELSEDELASLGMNELSLLLDNVSDRVKEFFDHLDIPTEDDYIGKDAALEAALKNVNISAEDAQNPRVLISFLDHKMVYYVRFVHSGVEYEFAIDAKSGEILSSDTDEYEEFDFEEKLEEFFMENGLDPEEIKDRLEDLFSPDRDDDDDEKETISRGEALKKLIKELELDGKKLKRTDVELKRSEKGTVLYVTLELQDGTSYEAIIEAYTGEIISSTEIKPDASEEQ